MNTHSESPISQYLLWYPAIHRAHTTSFETPSEAQGLLKDLTRWQKRARKNLKKENIIRKKRRLRPLQQPAQSEPIIRSVPTGSVYRIIGNSDIFRAGSDKN